MKSTLLALALSLVSSLSLSATPLPAKSKLLAQNIVQVKYVGQKDIPCHFRTALCPDRCGHATRVAEFEVLRNEFYLRGGEYGDAPAAVGSTLVADVKNPVEGQTSEMVDKMLALKPGDVLFLTQCHYYVEKDGNHYPVRPVTKLTPCASLALETPVEK